MLSDPGPEISRRSDFIHALIDEEKAAGRHAGGIVTRFPPEPNGYLHIGHAKSICLNFGIARDYGGRCHLRFDDTNPAKEDVEYINAIQEDVRWLGFDWGPHLYYASDYYERFCEYAVELISKGLAYVCHLSAQDVRQTRGTPTEPGTDSPYRVRGIEENLRLFQEMRSGAMPDGACTLRAKIDMRHPNINMRDPALYRIKRAVHPKTGAAWCIYPLYDFAHPISDAIEGITHSICTLEFEDHRPLYDWVLDNISAPCRPRQIEFARLNMTYTVMSKRKLLSLVQEGLVSGWDDPRMPTISGLRRRGVPPGAIRAFADRIGVDKTNSTVDAALLEFFIREDLNRCAHRRMAVLHPLRLIIDNYPAGLTEEFAVENNPEDPGAGTRMISFSGELWIEQDDFREDPPRKYFRLAPGREVRLKGAYYVTCRSVEKDPVTGAVSAVHCEYDPSSRGGGTPDGRRVDGTIHWVSAAHAISAEVRLYDRLFTAPDPEGGEMQDGYRLLLNADSRVVRTGCKLEPMLASASPQERYQFLRNGYFCLDPDSRPGAPVFNRTVTLRDTWVKLQKTAGSSEKQGH